jgi:hypothetical protein
MKQRVFPSILLMFFISLFLGSTAVIALAQNSAEEAETAVSYSLSNIPLSTENCPSPLRILPAGDSITYGEGSTGSGSDGTGGGYRGLLLTDLTNAGYTIDYVGPEASPANVGFDNHHAGFPGVETRYLEVRIFNWLKNLDTAGTPADVILLHIGTNNITSNNTTTTDLNNLLEEIDRYEQTYSRSVMVILAQIINRNCDSVQTNCATKKQQTIDYDNNIATMVQTRITNGDKLRLVDMRNDTGLDYDPPSPHFFDDKHPNNTGYDLMTTVWFDELDDYIATNCGGPLAPTITSTAVANAIVNQQYQYDVNATGDNPIAFSLTQKPTGMSINSSSGLITWTPTSGQVGPHEVTVVATNDTGSDTQLFTVTVNAAPTAPSITTTAATLAAPGQEYTYQVQATGYPNPTFGLTQKPSGMTIDANSGSITWTPGLDAAGDSETVTVTATNSEGSTSQTYTIKVNYLVFVPMIIK